MKNALTYILLIIASLGFPQNAAIGAGVFSSQVEIFEKEILIQNSIEQFVHKQNPTSPKKRLAYSLNADTNRVVAQQQHDDLRNWTHTSWLNVKNHSSSLSQSI